MKIRRNRDLAKQVVKAYKQHGRYDKMGMYTGSPNVDESDQPVQDADDL